MTLPLRLFLALSVIFGVSVSRIDGQITVTYTGDQNNTTSYDTTSNDLTLSVEDGLSATQSGVISGSGDVIKTGDGTVNFTAVNTYSGSTLISAGKLQISATHGLPNTSGVTVAAGATLELNGVLVRIDSLDGAGDILLTTGFGNLFTGDADDHEFSGNISGSGGLQKYGSGTLTLTGDNSNNSMTVVEGTLRGDIDSFATGYLGTSAGASIDFDQSTDATWAGALSGDGTFNKLGAGNLTLTGASSSFTGEAVVSAGTLTLANASQTLGNTATVTVDSGATLDLGTVSETIGTLNLTGGTVTASGGILSADTFNVESGTLSAGLAGKTGTSSLTKTTTGTVTLTTNATHTGATDVQAGILALSGASAKLTATSALTIGDSATASLTGSGGGTVTNTGTLTLGNTSSGDGTLSLSGAPSSGYALQNTGDIIIGNEGSGTLQLSSSASALAWANVRLATGTGGDGNLTLDSSSLIAVGNLVIGEGANSTGTVTLTNNASAIFLGYVEIGSGSGSTGQLNLTNGAGLGIKDATGDALRAGSGSATVTINDSSLTAYNGNLTTSVPITLTGDATFATGANAMALSGTLSGDGTLVKTGTGTLTLSGPNTYSGGTTVSGGTLSVAADAGLGSAPVSAIAGHLTLDGGTLATTASFTLNTNRSIALGATGGGLNTASATTLTYGGTIAGTGAFTKAGDGNLILTADQAYNGGTTVSGGTLTLGTGGTTGSVIGNIANSGTVVFDRSGDHTYTGVISGTGDVVHNGNILRLTAAQTYTGATTINAGYLVLPTDVDQGLAATTSVEVAAGGTFDFSNSNLTIASLSGAGDVYSFGGSGGNLTVNTTGQSQTFSGTLGSTYPNFALTKAGAGTLTLAGTNTYTGATTISGGTLALGADGTIATSSGISLGSGGVLDLTAKSSGFTVVSTQTLSGSGTVNLSSGQALIVDGTLAPGNSPGALTIDGNLALASDALTVMELAGGGGVAGTDFDQIIVTGDLQYGGTLQIAFADGFLPTAGQSFQLFIAASLSDTFSGYELPMVPGANWDITSLLSSGTLSLAAVPEPSAFAIIAGLVVSGLGWRRRRRSHDTGNATQKVAPAPGSESHPTSAPIASATRFATAKPMP